MKSNIYTIFVFLICLFCTYLVTEHYQQQLLAERQKHVTAESLTISHNIKQQLSSYIAQLQLTAQSWHSTKEINAHWHRDINNIKRLIPYIEQANIFDFGKQKGIDIGNENYVTLDKKPSKAQQLKYSKSLPTNLDRFESDKLFMSPPITLNNNEKAVYIYIPIFIEQDLFAYLQVSLNLTKLLSRQVDIYQLDQPFSLSENGISIFSRLPQNMSSNQVSEQFSIPIYSHDWKLLVWSTHQHAFNQYIPYIGLSLSLVITLLIYLFLFIRKLKQQIATQKIQLIEVNKAVKTNKSKLIQSNKLTSLGELATGLAHEINQPLQVICIHADLCNESLSKENYKLVEKDFNAILLQIDRIEKIVKQVGSFGRDSELNNYRDEQPSVIFDSVINIIRNQYMQEQIELRQVLPCSLPTIFCNKIQIEQVLVNLLINAKDALEYSETKIVFIKAYNKGDKLYIEVSDTGTGIANEKLDDIFTPFYTTKPLGKGTGLGLSISYSIIEQHTGELRVHSEVGKGTTFTVVLPQSQRSTELLINHLD